MSSKQVVILGTGVAGVAQAHKLLKHTAPKVKGLKVTLVGSSSHLYWNPAAVRGVIPDEIPDSSLFHEIEPGFAKYPESKFEFVLGTATALNLSGNAVQVQTPSGAVRTLNYDQLVIATGSRLSSGLPFKNLGSHEETLSAWHALQSQVKLAGSIVIAGAGATGVETTGELAFKYANNREKKITLIVDGDHALPNLLPAVGKAAEADLAKMNVDIIHKARVTDVQDSGSGSSSGKKLTLSNGRTLIADLYLPLSGVRANTEFIPPHLLDAGGNLQLQKTLRVVGLKNVWGAGDVGNLETKQVTKAEAQTVHLHANLDAVLAGNDAAVTEYKPSDKAMIFVTIGKKRGTGQMGSFKVFSFLVAMMKGKTLFIEKVPGIVAGKNIIQASV